MRFSLEKEKLMVLLQKLCCDDIFPVSILATKDGKLISSQREDDGNMIRYAWFGTHYFQSIDLDTDAIKIDVQRALNILKLRPPKELITVEKNGELLEFIGESGTTHLHYEKSTENNVYEIPFKKQNGIFYVGKGNVPLSKMFFVDLAVFRKTIKYGNILKTDYYHFSQRNRSIICKIGGERSFLDYHEMLLSGEIADGDDLEVTFTYGIEQIANTFSEEKFMVRTNTNAPGVFTEKSREKHYYLSIWIPPCVEEG